MTATNDRVPPQDAEQPRTDEVTPIVVDLGRKRRKLVKQLRQGRGKLMDDVSRVVQEMKETGAIAASAQPVIIVVREKPKAMSWMEMMR